MSKAVVESKLAGRGGYTSSAKRFRRTGPKDRTNLHAPLATAPASECPAVYWHRELPPIDAVPIGEHTLEAASGHVPHTIDHAEDLWNRCYDDLMEHAQHRLEQEILRLGGDCAHVLDEHVESKYDGAAGESWLFGRFRYVLYRRGAKTDRGQREGAV